MADGNYLETFERICIRAGCSYQVVLVLIIFFGISLIIYIFRDHIYSYIKKNQNPKDDTSEDLVLLHQKISASFATDSDVNARRGIVEKCRSKDINNKNYDRIVVMIEQLLCNEKNLKKLEIYNIKNNESIIDFKKELLAFFITPFLEHLKNDTKEFIYYNSNNSQYKYPDALYFSLQQLKSDEYHDILGLIAAEKIVFNYYLDFYNKL